MKTAQCLATIVPSLQGSGGHGERHGTGDGIISICPIPPTSSPGSPSTVLIATSRALYLLDLQRPTQDPPKCIMPPGKTHLLACAVSPHGKYAHVLCNHHFLQSISLETGQVEQKQRVCEENEVIALAQAKHSSRLAVTSDRGRVYLYQG